MPPGDTLTQSHVAAEDLAGPQAVAALEKAAEQAVPGLADEPAWPTLRARLLLLGASGIDPIAQLLSVVDTRELDSAVDRAAVLGWRLDDTGYRRIRPAALATRHSPTPPGTPDVGWLFGRPSSDRRRAGRRGSGQA